MKVPCLYPNETAVLFATGPSLTKEVIEIVRPYHASGKVRTFGCNDTYYVVDFLDVHYACDEGWWNYHGEQALRTLPKNCQVWTQDNRSRNKFHINHIDGEYSPGLWITDRTKIHYGSNSGFQQLNLAYHYGIRKFLLVGYNMGLDKGKTHFFGDHPSDIRRVSPYDKFLENYNKIQKDIKPLIINCTENSHLTCFRKSDLLTELARL